MSQANQAVVLRVAAGEQGASRGRAQRGRGVRAAEQDALRSELIQARAGDVGVAICAEVAAEVVPMHEQHVVASLSHCLFSPSRRTTEQGAQFIRQPFGSRRATYPQIEIHPQAGPVVNAESTRSEWLNFVE